MKPDADWFRQQLERHRLSQSGLGRMLGIDKSSMSLLLAGKRKLSLEHAADIARIFGVTTSEVMKRMGVRVDGIVAGDPSAAHLLPFEGWIDETGAVNKDGNARRRRIDVGVSVEPGAAAYQFRTLQTKMDIVDGWIVVVGAKREPDDKIIDRGCVVGTKSGPVLLRAIRRGYTSGSHTLLGIGLPDATEAEVAWYAPVLLIKPAKS